MEASHYRKRAINGLTEEEKKTKRLESNRKASQRLRMKIDQQIHDLVTEKDSLTREMKRLEEQREIVKQEKLLLNIENDLLRSLLRFDPQDSVDSYDGVDLLQQSMLGDLYGQRNVQSMSGGDFFEPWNTFDAVQPLHDDFLLEQRNAFDVVRLRPDDFVEQRNVFGRMQ